MDPQPPNTLRIIETPVPGAWGIVLRVADSMMGTFTMPTRLSTTYAALAFGGPKPRVSESVFAGMIFTHNEGGPDGYHSFYFHTARSSEAAAVAVHSHTEVDASMYWPDVLYGLSFGMNREGNYRITPTLKTYTGPTKVLVEEFFGLTPFSIDVPAVTMQAMPYDGLLFVVGATTYDDIRGELHLGRCLRAAATHTVPIIPYSSGITTFTQASLIVDATSPTEWPETLVVSDSQHLVAGGWLRRKVTAYRPYDSTP